LKRFVLGLGAVLLSAGLVTGCGVSTSEDGEAATRTVETDAGEAEGSAEDSSAKKSDSGTGTTNASDNTLQSFYAFEKDDAADGSGAGAGEGGTVAVDSSAGNGAGSGAGSKTSSGGDASGSASSGADTDESAGVSASGTTESGEAGSAADEAAGGMAASSAAGVDSSSADADDGSGSALPGASSAWQPGTSGASGSGESLSKRVILVYVDHKLSKDDLDQLLAKYDLSVVYDYTNFHAYALSTKQDYSDKEMDALIAALKKEKGISDVQRDSAVTLDQKAGDHV